MDKRKKYKVRSLQQAAFLCLVRMTDGGHDGVATYLGMSRQTTLNFLKNGVNWKCIYKLSTFYKVSPYLIDYKVCTLVMGPIKESLYDLIEKVKNFTPEHQAALKLICKKYGDLTSEDILV